MRVTVRDLIRFKAEGRKFPVLTAYDFLTASILDEAGIPVLLVGDTLGQVVLGYETTLPVTMEEMIHHTAAVARGARSAMVVADMPFGSYQGSVREGFENAVRFLKEAGASAVKIEGPRLELTQMLVEHGIPVVGHLGLTPQSVHALGGYRVQGRTPESADRLQSDALSMQKAGATALVLEAIPETLGRSISSALAIPTIGIGAGSGCDAQVLVITDLLGMGAGAPPKFVKPYANLRETIGQAVRAFKTDVEEGRFPGEAQTYR
ncbi:MAG TPA: 3-methyl-2-oxobutanoate hydroxymethyltransferase [Actinomycetota bacterium]|nr:3-methyl-2-oxobutanoate hydroxymethyltransferase [Actinomycetota bacterium]